MEERRKQSTRRITDSEYLNGYEQGKKDAQATNDTFLYSFTGLLIGISIIGVVATTFSNLISDPTGKEKIGFLPLFVVGSLIALGMTTFDWTFKFFGRLAYITTWASVGASISTLVMMYAANMNKEAYTIPSLAFVTVAFVSLAIQGGKNLDAKEAAASYRFPTD